MNGRTKVVYIIDPGFESFMPLNRLKIINFPAGQIVDIDALFLKRINLFQGPLRFTLFDLARTEIKKNIKYMESDHIPGL